MNKIYKYTDISDSNMIFSLKIKFVLEPPFEFTRLKERGLKIFFSIFLVALKRACWAKNGFKHTWL